MVTKRDGTQEAYNPEVLRTDLLQSCEGLDMNFINVDIIVGKVSSGLPQGNNFFKYNINLRCKNFLDNRLVCRNMRVYGNCAPRLHNACQ